MRQSPQEQALEPSPELLAMLVCPVCRTPVKLTSDRQGLRCSSCRLIYPIRDGFPVMIKEEARPDAA
jgi:LSD1 subclass zinc finger protein